jgi:hypothetical protein
MTAASNTPAFTVNFSPTSPARGASDRALASCAARSICSAAHSRAATHRPACTASGGVAGWTSQTSFRVRSRRVAQRVAQSERASGAARRDVRAAGSCVQARALSPWCAAAGPVAARIASASLHGARDELARGSSGARVHDRGASPSPASLNAPPRAPSPVCPASSGRTAAITPPIADNSR